jgi:signal transduction histidine kinase
VNLISNAIKFTEDGGITVNIYFSDKETINNDEQSKSTLHLNHQNKSSEYNS